jgi:hypothetical protein
MAHVIWGTRYNPSRGFDKREDSPWAIGAIRFIHLESAAMAAQSSLSVVLFLRIYDGHQPYHLQRSYLFIALRLNRELLSRHDTGSSAAMAKVSWSCVEVSCCVPNCATPCFHPKISHSTSQPSPAPLSPSTPISSCNARPPLTPGDVPSSPCCRKMHKHFLYSIVLPTSSTFTSNPNPSPSKTTPTTASLPSSAPIITPSSPPERPSLRARRDTLSKLKIPESPPLSSPEPIAAPPPREARSSPARTPARHPSAGTTSRYPNMFLPMPGQQTLGSRTVSPMSSYTPLLSRDILAMSPISPLMHSPSPIMSAA